MSFVIACAFCLIGLCLVLVSHGVQIIGLLLIYIGMLVLFASDLKFISSPWLRRTLRKRRITSLVLGTVSFILLILLDLPIIRGAKTDVRPGTDYLIVFGAAVYGETPSPSLRDRLDAALLYLNENPGTRVIVSGGMGPGERITEAEAMRVYLESGGIAPERIIMESKATDTSENLRYSFSLIEKEKAGSLADFSQVSIAVVSSEYHLYRIRYLADKLGHPVSGIAAPTSYWYLKVNYFIREIPAMLKAMLLD
ncbi:MAG: YdcF family protein [Firmicutes bacterium]|nr:YdcF family protein [Bacillota bacterium]